MWVITFSVFASVVWLTNLPKWFLGHRGRQMMETLSASAGLQACLFASGILIARGLGPSGRGNLALVVTLPAVATQMVCVGLPSAATYFIARNRPAWPTIVRHVRVVAIVQMLIAAVVLLGLVEYFLAGRESSAYTAGLIAVGSVPVLIAQYYGLHILQGLGSMRWFNVYRVAPAAAFSIGVGVGLYFGVTVLTCTAIWLGSVTGNAVAIATTLFMKARAGARHDVSHQAPPTQREMMQFGVAGFLAQVSPVETFRVDILVVAALFPSSVIGYYAVATSLSNVPRFIADALVGVAYPQISAQSAREGHASTRRYILAAIAACGIAALVVAMAAPYILPRLFGKAFEPAVGVSILLVAATAVISIRRVGLDCLRALGKPGASTGVEVVVLVTLGGGFVILAPWGNGRGVALSLALSATIGLVFLFWVLRRAESKVL